MKKLHCSLIKIVKIIYYVPRGNIMTYNDKIMVVILFEIPYMINKTLRIILKGNNSKKKQNYIILKKKKVELIKII